MTVPALPAPSTITPAELAALGAGLVDWCQTVDDIAQVKDVSARWAAITEYARRTSRDGIAEAEAVLRRLETRIGQLDKSRQGARTDLELCTYGRRSSELHWRTASEFRLMAKHPEIVEAVIADSTDANPPSRRKVVGAIRKSVDDKETADELAEIELRLPVIEAILASLPDRKRIYLVTIRIKSEPEYLGRWLPAGYEVVNIREENPT